MSSEADLGEIEVEKMREHAGDQSDEGMTTRAQGGEERIDKGGNLEGTQE